MSLTCIGLLCLFYASYADEETEIETQILEIFFHTSMYFFALPVYCQVRVLFVFRMCTCSTFQRAEWMVLEVLPSVLKQQFYIKSFLLDLTAMF